MFEVMLGGELFSEGNQLPAVQHICIVQIYRILALLLVYRKPPTLFSLLYII